jgi:hypothetical protein
MGHSRLSDLTQELSKRSRIALYFQSDSFWTRYCVKNIMMTHLRHPGALLLAVIAVGGVYAGNEEFAN